VIRKGVIVGIIFVFVFTSLSLVSVGFQSNRNEKYAFPQWYGSSNSYYPQNYITTQSNIGIYLPESTYEKSFGIENCIMNSPWPMHGHDIHHTGRSPFNTINTTGIEKWCFNAQDLVDGSAIVDNNGTIYFGAMDNFYALYPNGTMKWHEIFGSNIGMFGTSPAIDENGMIYVPTMSGLVAIFSNNGTIKWAYGGDVETSPVIGSDGTIYFGQTSGSTGYINAIYPNGTIRWRYHTNHVVYSSPAIGLNGTVYCGSHDGNLYAFYPENGTVKWAFPTGNWVHGSPTVGFDGTIYIGSDDTYLYALYPNGTMKWKIGVGSMRTSPSLDKWGTLYFGVWESAFQAVYPNGTMKWSYNLGTRNGVWGSTAAISDDGTIYCGVCVDIDYGKGGNLIALNLDGTEKWSKRIADEYETSSPCIAQDGTVYIGSCWIAGGGYLHAFGSGEQKTIEITQPKPGGIYLLGLNLGNSPNGKTIILGSVTVKAQSSMENEIDSVSFIVDGSTQNTTTKPPFKWNMNLRYWKWPPLMQFTITVTVKYKGGCTWSDSMDVLYLHLRHNYPK
jgi:outer membrane protein assembly factor BamB